MKSFSDRRPLAQSAKPQLIRLPPKPTVFSDFRSVVWSKDIGTPPSKASTEGAQDYFDIPRSPTEKDPRAKFYARSRTVATICFVSGMPTIKITVSPPIDEACFPAQAGYTNGDGQSLERGRNITTQSQVISDSTLLMPPQEHAANQRIASISEVEEYSQVQTWLIEFLNTKAHTLPPDLRTNIMHIYGIKDRNLTPEMAEKLELGMEDEGLGLESKDPLQKDEAGQNNADALLLLKEAFRSQVARMAPSPMPLESTTKTFRKIQSNCNIRDEFAKPLTFDRSSTLLHLPAIKKAKSAPNLREHITPSSDLANPPRTDPQKTNKRGGLSGAISSIRGVIQSKGAKAGKKVIGSCRSQGH